MDESQAFLSGRRLIRATAAAMERSRVLCETARSLSEELQAQRDRRAVRRGAQNPGPSHLPQGSESRRTSTAIEFFAARQRVGRGA
jgi:hypothetical protein